MTDCPNAEIRDRLPDLALERLDASERALVLAHLERCAECRAELELLREYRRTLDAASRVDSARIARGVIARTVRAPARVAPTASRRPRWMDWRVAATIAVAAAGGASLITLRETGRLAGPDSVVAESPGVDANTPSGLQSGGATAEGTTTAVVASRGNTASASGARPAHGARELSIGAGMSDLSDEQLQALLDEMDRVDALPSPDPEPVMVHVTPTPPEGGEE